MIGFLVGFVCGLAELFLLVRLTSGIGKRGSAYTAAIFFAKVMVFGLSAAVVLLIAKQQVIWYAAGVTGVLIFGSAGMFCKQAFGGDKNNA